MYKKALIYGLGYGIIKSTIIEFAPIDDVIKGLLVINIFIILLMLMYYKTKPNLKIALICFIVFTLVFFAISSIMTFIYNNPGSDFTNVLSYETKRIYLLIIIGLLITFFRLSKAHFLKLSSIVLVFFIGMFLFAAFNKEFVQELIDSQKKEQIKMDIYDDGP